MSFLNINVKLQLRNEIVPLKELGVVVKSIGKVDKSWQTPTGPDACIIYTTSVLGGPLGFSFIWSE